MKTYERITSTDHFNDWGKLLNDPNIDDREMFDWYDPYIYSGQNTDFFKSEKVSYVRHYHDLPEEVLKQIKLVLKLKPINMGGCFYNSSYLSLLVDGVEKVDGFIYDQVEEDFKYETVEDLGDGILIIKRVFVDEEDKEWCNESGFGEDYEFLFDTNKNKKIIHHSWNKYNDIHFDLTLKLDWNGHHYYDGGSSNTWIEYFQLQTPPITDVTMKNVILSVCDINNIFMTSKCKVRNRFTISDDLWDMIGSQISSSGYMLDERYRQKDFDDHQDEYRDYQNKYLELEGIQI